MYHKSITWATVLEKVYSGIKDHQFLTDLIDSHKHGTAAPVTLPPQYWDQHKRPKTQTRVTPDEKKPTAFPSCVDTKGKRELLTTFLWVAGMIPTLGETHPPKAAAVTNTEGNQYKNADWAQKHLAITRKDNWTCTKGTGTSSYFSNPKKVVHTLFN